MLSIIHNIIDYIFPPREEEIILRRTDAEWLMNNCAYAINTEFSFIKAIFSYKEPLIRELIWQIKYRKNSNSLKKAGLILYRYIINNYTKDIILIPIPISKERRKERGYNQCELIIKEILNNDTDNIISFDNKSLIRGINIEKQTHKNRAERIENTKHIFKVINTENKDKKVLIIDDVTTTGSTLSEAREELIISGYTDVQCLAIAH